MAAVSSNEFYATYHGHDVEYLGVALSALRRSHSSVVFLAGDSSLDNKYWLTGTEKAVNGYEEFLRPPRMKTDICYWLNVEAQRRDACDICCLNTAIEATSLSDRACCWLQPQDRFIRDHIRSEDYLVVSVGGNDIALKPLLCTCVNMLCMQRVLPRACLEDCACGAPPVFPPTTCVDGGCFCCGLPGCVTGLLAWPPSLGYFLDLFGNLVQAYVMRLLGCRRPRKVVICMIYYPDEHKTGSWADGALSALGYDSDPTRLQLAIRQVFKLATSRICIPGTEVVAFPLFEVLDGKTTQDYVARVEPSSSGGAKMARALMDEILNDGTSASDASSNHAPTQLGME